MKSAQAEENLCGDHQAEGGHAQGEPGLANGAHALEGTEPAFAEPALRLVEVQCQH